MKLYAILPFVLQCLAWPIAHGIFHITGSFTLKGYEHIKDVKGPVVFVANHVNDLDPVLTRAMLPWFSKPLFWLARYRKYYNELPEEQRWKGWQSFLYGDWFFRSWGAHPAHAGMQDYAKSLEHIIKLVNDGYSVCIFPRGGKEKYLGSEAPIHGGAGFLASYTGASLVPVAISGTLKLGPKELFFGGRKLAITIGAPIQIPKTETQESPEFYRKYVTQAVDTIYQVLM